MSRNPWRLWPPASLIAVAIVGWQLASWLADVPDWLLPSPFDVVIATWEARSLLWGHVAQTMQETLLGLGLALSAGLILGWLVDTSPAMRAAVYPLLVVSQTIPIVAIAPLLVIWFGYGLLPKVLVVGLICFFPVAVNTAEGFRGVDHQQLDLLRTMGADARDLLLKVRIPGALPSILAGVKVAATYSVIGAIMGEWVGGSRGLGILMMRSTNSFRTDRVFAAVGVTALLSLALFALATGVERWALRWRSAGRPEEWEELAPSRGEGHDA